MQTHRSLILVVATFALLVSRAGADPSPPNNHVAPPGPRYELIDLGIQAKSEYSRAYAINDKDQVVGQIADADGLKNCRPVLWDKGSVSVLPCPPGPFFYSGLAINNSGLMCGANAMATGSMHPYQLGGSEPICRWKAGILSIVPKPANGYGAAIALNESGALAGFLDDRATVWKNGAPTTLGTGAWGSKAWAINNSGDCAGESSGLACVWLKGGQTNIGALPGDKESSAHGINEIGTVVGVSGAVRTTPAHAFVWRKGQLTQLSAVSYWNTDTWAYGINSSEQIVGCSTDAADHLVACVWIDDRVYDLNECLADKSDLTLMMAYAINGAGDIVGDGWDKQCRVHAFLLRRVTAGPSSGPKPASAGSDGMPAPR